MKLEGWGWLSKGTAHNSRQWKCKKMCKENELKREAWWKQGLSYVYCTNYVDKLDTPQDVLTFETRFKFSLPSSDSNSCAQEFSCSSDFCGRCDDLAWPLCSYVTLNLIRLRENGKERRRKHSTEIDHNPFPFLSLRPSGPLGCVLVNQRGLISLQWCQTYVVMTLCDGYLTLRLSMLVHVLYCTNLLSITTKVPKKHPQRKVKLCHQFPLKNSPWLGKTEGSASSFLYYLSCAHIKGALNNNKAKNKNGKHEGKAGECDVMLSVIHAFTQCSLEKGERERKGEKLRSFTVS